jgi:hypothetical protein
MEQAGRATWTAKPRRVAASESGDERVQSPIISGPIATDKSEMFESLASCFAFCCSAPLNMTGRLKGEFRCVTLSFFSL